MAIKQKKGTGAETRRLRLTVQPTLEAYDAIEKIRRQHRIRSGKDMPKWKAIDKVVRAYAKQKGFREKK